MTFFSHSKKGDAGIPYGSKRLTAHIKGVSHKALQQLSPTCQLGYETEELKQFLQDIILFHDLGKYTGYFQNYLLKQEPIDALLKQHARLGGIAAYNQLKQRNETQAILGLYLIFLHHSPLVDPQDVADSMNAHLKRIIDLQRKDIEKSQIQISSELQLQHLPDLLTYPDERHIRRGLKTLARGKPTIQNYYLINYLFSLLIEADKLDASDTEVYSLRPIESDAVDKRFGKPDFQIKTPNFNTSQHNDIRNFCRAQVIAQLGRNDILDQFIFTLTAPTGTGKTMIALDFALKLRAKIKEKLKLNTRIIYALPFINIIEQALHEYRTTLPPDTAILAHYHYADVFGDRDIHDQDGAKADYNQTLMALDTWQGDIVITSFVQFFETLIGNRNKLLKKFNHFANSIIILDEVQTLRLDQMPLVGAALFYLSKFLKARIILMTATRPEILELAEQQILSVEGDEVNALELLPDHRAVFSAYQRTKIVPLLHIDLNKNSIAGDFVQEVFSSKWESTKSCILVCNTVKTSIEMHDALAAWLANEGLSNKLEYLSTNVVPADRLGRIQAIAEEIAAGKAPILVSTQVVEAGVDLDFDMGFRDIGPIDSIVQVAGRINRNNSGHKTHSPLFVVDLGDATKIYGRITYDQAKAALLGRTELLEDEYFGLVERYFDNISDKKSFSRFNKIFESMKLLRYDSPDPENDRPVSSFKIIEESQSTQSVYIEINDYAIILRDNYLAKIKRELSKSEFDRLYKRDFHQRIIAVPVHLTTNLPYINDFDSEIKVITHESLAQYYNHRTGFIRKKEDPITFL